MADPYTQQQQNILAIEQRKREVEIAAIAFLQSKQAQQNSINQRLSDGHPRNKSVYSKSTPMAEESRPWIPTLFLGAEEANLRRARTALDVRKEALFPAPRKSPSTNNHLRNSGIAFGVAIILMFAFPPLVFIPVLATLGFGAATLVRMAFPEKEKPDFSLVDNGVTELQYSEVVNRNERALQQQAQQHQQQQQQQQVQQTQQAAQQAQQTASKQVQAQTPAPSVSTAQAPTPTKSAAPAPTKATVPAPDQSIEKQRLAFRAKHRAIELAIGSNKNATDKVIAFYTENSQKEKTEAERFDILKKGLEVGRAALRKQINANPQAKQAMDNAVTKAGEFTFDEALDAGLIAGAQQLAVELAKQTAAAPDLLGLSDLAAPVAQTQTAVDQDRAIGMTLPPSVSINGDLVDAAFNSTATDGSTFVGIMAAGSTGQQPQVFGTYAPSSQTIPAQPFRQQVYPAHKNPFAQPTVVPVSQAVAATMNWNAPPNSRSSYNPPPITAAPPPAQVTPAGDTAEVTRLKEQLAQRERELKYAKTDHQQTKDQLQYQTKGAVTAGQDHVKERGADQTRITELEKKVAAQSDQINQDAQALSSEETKRKQAEATLSSQTNAVVSSGQDRAKERAAEQAKIKVLEAQVGALNGMVEHERQRADTADTELQRIKASDEVDLKARVARLDTSEAEVQEAKQAQERAEEAAQAALTEGERLKGQVTELQGQVTEQAETLNNTAGSNQQLNTGLTNMKAQLEEAQAQNEQLRVENAALQDANKAATRAAGPVSEASAAAGKRAREQGDYNDEKVSRKRARVGDNASGEPEVAESLENEGAAAAVAPGAAQAPAAPLADESAIVAVAPGAAQAPAAPLADESAIVAVAPGAAQAPAAPLENEGVIVAVEQASEPELAIVPSVGAAIVPRSDEIVPTSAIVPASAGNERQMDAREALGLDGNAELTSNSIGRAFREAIRTEGLSAESTGENNERYLALANAKGMLFDAIDNPGAEETVEVRALTNAEVAEQEAEVGATANAAIIPEPEAEVDNEPGLDEARQAAAAEEAKAQAEEEKSWTVVQKKTQEQKKSPDKVEPEKNKGKGSGSGKNRASFQKNKKKHAENADLLDKQQKGSQAGAERARKLDEAMKERDDYVAPETAATPPADKSPETPVSRKEQRKADKPNKEAQRAQKAINKAQQKEAKAAQAEESALMAQEDTPTPEVISGAGAVGAEYEGAIVAVASAQEESELGIVAVETAPEVSAQPPVATTKAQTLIAEAQVKLDTLATKASATAQEAANDFADNKGAQNLAAYTKSDPDWEEAQKQLNELRKPAAAAAEAAAAAASKATDPEAEVIKNLEIKNEELSQKIVRLQSLIGNEQGKEWRWGANQENIGIWEDEIKKLSEQVNKNDAIMTEIQPSVSNSNVKLFEATMTPLGNSAGSVKAPLVVIEQYAEAAVKNDKAPSPTTVAQSPSDDEGNENKDGSSYSV